ncbi:MAG: M48 family metallopeptidase, partial [Vicinamibacteraceae bacterium]|nr:M48 family metallopeptidase [Vicinamibacteraceae bacterium]
MTRRHSLARRALMALALMVGFYALALFIVVALLWIPYAEYAYLGRVHIKIALLCVGGAGAILWALLPRADRFDPPGPRVDEAHHPRLWARIREVAAGTGQEMPREVYLLNEVNAWVTHRGGVMGFGSQRVMGIGLPLLQVLSVPQLKAVIAHEFGHYESGDVRLGPWTYKTRAAIGRTLEQLDASWLAKPFEWYASLFVRLTHSVSRQQEFVADAVGARVAGAAAQAGALRRVAALAPAFDTYMRSEVVPVLRAGYLPPVASGFQAFWQVETMADWFTRCANEEARTGISDPFDTHPSLRERLAALGVDETPGDWSAPDPPAIELVDDP